MVSVMERARLLVAVDIRAAETAPDFRAARLQAAGVDQGEAVVLAEDLPAAWAMPAPTDPGVEKVSGIASAQARAGHRCGKPRPKPFGLPGWRRRAMRIAFMAALAGICRTAYCAHDSGGTQSNFDYSKFALMRVVAASGSSFAACFGTPRVFFGWRTAALSAFDWVKCRRSSMIMSAFISRPLPTADTCSFF